MDRPARSGSTSRAPSPASAISPPATSPRSDPEAAGATAVLTVDLGAVAANYRHLAALAAPAECAAVVKADAYGLGLSDVAPALAAAGARTFFVARGCEGAALRALLPGAAIGVLDGLVPGSEALLAAHGLVPVLNAPDEIGRWSAHARRSGRPLPAYVHLDTGMSRLGLDEAEQDALAADPGRLAGIEVCAWVSHYACADMADSDMTGRQARRFRDILRRLPAAPASLAASSGLFRRPGDRFDLVRPGAALYGINPTPEAPNPMRPAVSLAARILQVRTVAPGATVGYGAAHRVGRPGRVATLGIGYADGFLRSVRPGSAVWIGGRPAPLVGRVSMDLIAADVTGLPEDAAQPGAWAEILGPHRSVDDAARDAGTIGYEVLTSLGGRFARRVLGAAL